MTLAKKFLPLLWPTIRLYAGSLRVCSRPQYRRHGQPLAVRHNFPQSHARLRVACPRIPHSRVLILALVGCFFGILTLSLPHAIALWLGASSAISHPGVHPLTYAARPAVPSDERCTQHDYDVDYDESLATLLLTSGAHVFPQALRFLGFDGSPHTCSWPIHYLARPQRLTRL